MTRQRCITSYLPCLFLIVPIYFILPPFLLFSKSTPNAETTT